MDDEIFPPNRRIGRASLIGDTCVSFGAPMLVAGEKRRPGQGAESQVADSRDQFSARQIGPNRAAAAAISR